MAGCAVCVARGVRARRKGKGRISAERCGKRVSRGERGRTGLPVVYVSHGHTMAIPAATVRQQVGAWGARWRVLRLQRPWGSA